MTDVRRERIPLLWSRVRESVSATCLRFNMGDAKCPRVCVSQKLHLVIPPVRHTQTCLLSIRRVSVPKKLLTFLCSLDKEV